VKTDFLV
jgi:hypothetical protein